MIANGGQALGSRLAVCGGLQVMPLLILCMGGEMIYILEQRLEAQKIAMSKGRKVLYDVIKSMFFPRFLQELFKPQGIFTMASCRQIFDRLAHSSIMRLNESSMDKLMDLITMGFKYQFLCCHSGEELVDVTLNHIAACKRICAESPELLALVQQGEALFQAQYEHMSMYAYRELRMQLGTFFQDRRVKVSLFLQNQTQNTDGAIVVPFGGSLPFNTLPPGTVTYLQQDLRQDILTGMASTGDVFQVNPDRIARVNPGGSCYWSLLGTNLYAKSKSTTEPGGANTANSGSAAMSGPESNEDRKHVAVDQLNTLAGLLQPQKVEASDVFHFNNLFSGEKMFDMENSSGTLQRNAEATKHKPAVLKHANVGYQGSMDTIRKDLDHSDAGPKTGVSQEDADLLDLLG
ncbi:unnamed protein product [Amoebophrya sp. A25]|nr:unnamed protein product [Amoebophrya sp. A25]|eukprot:GSA25T00005295001.1